MSSLPEDTRPGTQSAAEAARLHAEMTATAEVEARFRAEKSALRAIEARREAEAARTRAEAEARAAAEAHGQALEESARARAAAEAEAARARAAAEKTAREVAERSAEARRLREYGAKLEARHRDLLASRGWQMMEPARRLARLLRGKPAPAPFEPRLSGTPAAPVPASPKPASPKPASPKPAAPKQAAPEQAAPEQATPKSSAPKPALPKPVPAEPAKPKRAQAPKVAPKVTATVTATVAPEKGKRRAEKAGKPKRARAADAERALDAGMRHALGAEALALAAKGDNAGLLALGAALSARRGEGAAFLARFATLLALVDRAAFTEAAALADEIAARFPAPWIDVSFDPAVTRRLAIATATTLSRVGRQAEARAVLDAVIATPPRGPRAPDTTKAPDPGAPPVSLLLWRAEITWPHDPAAARADLAAAAAREPLPPAYRVLTGWLDHLDGMPAAELALRVTEHRQMRLVAASAALAAGDFAGYRAFLNDFFAEQGLTPPLPADAAGFSFGALAAPAAEANTAGIPVDGPLVTVIMTTFQSRETIDYALGSLRAQTHGALEILVVDDGSTDGTRERLAELAAADPRIRVLLNAENMGTYCAKNRGMAEARGAYVTFHDSDDWAHPERIARHVARMEAEPALIATRSDWLRVEGDGALNFRRWKKRFQHPNPASTFLRRGVIESAGYFDSVRYGADSEYWFRLKALFGRRVRSIPLTLGLGFVRAGSLTRAGGGAMDAENYAPTRGAYSAAYLRWHAETPAAALKLPPRLGAARPFAAPEEMVTAPPGEATGEVPEFVFGISFASKAATGDWDRTSALLGATLRSLLNQGDPRFSVIICGHERPDLPELDDPRVIFMRADIDPPKGPAFYRRDKMRKRRLIAAALRARGGGYFFPLDADDLVHRDLVAHVRADDNRRGYLIEDGFALDHNNGVLAPIPGAWSVPFDRTCGSSAVLWFAKDELPESGDLDEALYFNLFQSHAYWPIIAEEFGRPLARLPFPGGVYVVNHAQNLSFQLQRRGVRSENIIRAIARHRIADGAAILARDFGQEAAPGSDLVSGGGPGPDRA